MVATETHREFPSEGKEVSPTGSIDDKIQEETPHRDDSRFEKRTLLWMDIRILPILALVYSFSFIDRINLGAAYAAGMATTLELTVGARYTIVTCLYFIPYILLQLPGNFVLRRVGVRNWLSFLVLAWGSVQLGMGFVKNWEQLLATRVLLGAFEAPLYPSLVWLISAWYKRYEVQTRISIFSMLAGTAGGMSPLLGYGLSLLEGRRGLEGWRWIFIVEGAITMLLALVTFLFVPAFPEENSFLTKEQTDFVIKRIDDDRGDALPDDITLAKILHHLSDWTLWAYGVLFMLAVMPNYATGYFLPIILAGMGYDRKGTLIRSAMPSIAAIPVIVGVGWLSDRYQNRAKFIALLVLVSIVGCSLTAWHSNNGVRYFGVFLTYMASVAGGPTIVAYSSNNVVSHSKRAVQTATMVACGSVGGILAATLFRNQDRPKYIPGLIATMISQGIIAAVLVALTLRHRYWNKRAHDGTLKEPLEGQKGFLYTL
ncbi:major facilitator superfamily domain-containing protein [Coprinopsis sp. MPI-PUGE-AT-0042]|nr:major facilitator superfamily domain-containing protein [Coprinopsis sp. MPI-PUGE-AT-0042]